MPAPSRVSWSRKTRATLAAPCFSTYCPCHQAEHVVDHGASHGLPGQEGLAAPERACSAAAGRVLRAGLVRGRKGASWCTGDPWSLSTGGQRTCAAFRRPCLHEKTGRSGNPCGAASARVRVRRACGMVHAPHESTTLPVWIQALTCSHCVRALAGLQHA